jgi:hypothetical protein
MKLSQKKGLVAIVAFFLIIAVSLAVMPIIMGNLAFFSLSEPEKAFFIAESGIRYYIKYEDLSNNPDWSKDKYNPANPAPTITKNFGGGTFTVVPQNPAQKRITLRSSGSVTVGSAEFKRQVEYTLLKSGSSAFSGDYVMYGGGGGNGGDGIALFDHINNGEISGADLYLKGTFTAAHSQNLEVEQDIYQNENEAEIPSVNWAYWQSIANQTLSGDQEFKGTSYNGIYYINGNLELDNNNMVVNGTLVVTGNITCTNDNNITLNPDGSRPALIAGGDINIGHGNNILVDGPIYAWNDVYIDHGNNMTINGPVVFGDDFTTDNTNNIVISMSLNINDDGFTGGQQSGGNSAFEDKIGIRAFKEFVQ